VILARRGIAVIGWVVGNESASTGLKIWSGDELVAQAPVDMKRPDVEAAHPGLPGAADSGFRVILEPENFGTGALSVEADLANGRPVPVGALRVEVRPPWLTRLNPWKLVSSLREKHGEIQWTVLSPPEEREKVLVGKDGWLFLRRDSNDVIGQQTGRVRLGRRRRKAWQRLLRERTARAANLGAAWQCLIIPDKEFLYSEHLPDGITSAGRRPVHEILDLASSTGAPVDYALADLEAAKEEEQLFPKTDTHWNQRGSYVAYRSLCRGLASQGLEVPVLSEETISWSRAEAPGGLGLKLYPQPVSATIRADLAEHRARLVSDNRILNHGRVMVFEQDRGDGMSAVIFGESFVQNMLVFLKESFRRLVFVHTSTMAAGVLEHERPDAILSVPLERFLVRVPDDRNALLRLCEEAARKLALNRLSPAHEPFLLNVPRAALATERTGAFSWPAAVGAS
jgi:alginate O-acetyltransferase complex protein AlgJ